MSVSISLPAFASAESSAATLNSAAVDKSQIPALTAGQSRDEKVLQQFESVMLAMMLKQMRSSASEEGLFPGDKSDTLGGMFDSYMGDHLAESGGLGITGSLGPYLNRAASSTTDTGLDYDDKNTKAMEAYQNEISRSASL